MKRLKTTVEFTDDETKLKEAKSHIVAVLILIQIDTRSITVKELVELLEGI